MPDQIKKPSDLVYALKKTLGVKIDDEEEKPANYRYIIYCRKSSESSERQVRSLSDQLAECKDLADKLGLNFSSRPILESASAKEPDIRPKFRQMVEDIKKGKYDGIIAWHPDRLARNMKDSGEIIDLLDKNIIKDLKFVSFTFENSTTGKMLLGIAFVLSKQYSDQLSDNVKRGIKRSIQEGKYVNTPKHGYCKDRNQLQWTDGENFVLVEDAFKMRLENKTLDEIAKHFNDNNYTRAGKSGAKRKPYKMDKKRISEILRDPFYAGALLYGESVVDLTEIYSFTPAVSVDDFLKINKLSNISKAFKLAEAKFKTGSIKADLLRGKVFCGKCGGIMSAGITPKKNKGGVTRYFYYRCDNEDCEFYGKSVRAKVIIDWVIDYLEKHPFTSKPAYKTYVKEMNKVLENKEKELKRRLKSIQQQKNQAETKLEKTKEFLVGETDVQIKNTFKQDVKQLKSKIKESDKNIGEVKNQIKDSKATILQYPEFLELFNNLAKIITKTKSMKDLDFILQKLFLNFTLEDKKVANYTLNSPFGELVKTVKIRNGRAGETRTRNPLVPNQVP